MLRGTSRIFCDPFPSKHNITVAEGLLVKMEEFYSSGEHCLHLSDAGSINRQLTRRRNFLEQSTLKGYAKNCWQHKENSARSCPEKAADNQGFVQMGSDYRMDLDLIESSL